MNKILEIYNDYKLEAQKYFREFQNKVSKIWRKVQKSLNNTSNRKKYLSLAVILIVLNLLLVNLFISYSYYEDVASVPLIHSKVGNLLNQKYDYVLEIYLKDNDQYHIVNNIPDLGYQYSGYKCLNDSTLIYDESTKSTSVTLSSKDACSIYFDPITTPDIKLNIMLEEEFLSNTYKIGNYIPSYGYKYERYSCENNSTLEYNEELHSVVLTTDQKDNCSLYFKKEATDIDITLYVENTFNTKDYIERMSIPQNNTYVLNAEKTICQNKNGERIDGAISYTDGFIEVTTSSVTSCQVYLDKNE